MDVLKGGRSGGHVFDIDIGLGRGRAMMGRWVRFVLL